MLSSTAVLALSLAMPMPDVAPLPAVDVQVAQPPTLDTLVVTGTLPGPGLWQVSNGDNTLWILGTVTPLPKDMTWDSSEVDALVAAADEVLAPGGFTATLGAGGALRMLTLIPSALAAGKNPDGKKLVDVLPPDMYAQWAALKKKYMGSNRKVERRRPMIASMELHGSAIRAAGMTRDATVWQRVEAVAEKHDVAITDTSHQMKLSLKRKQAKDAISSIAGSRPADIACMDATLATLERDLQTMVRNANAWATGDVEILRQIEQDDLQPACRRLQDEAMGLVGLPDVEQTLAALWLQKADAALSRNRSTVAVVPVTRLLAPATGLLAQLRERGYSIVAPDDEPLDGSTDAFDPLADPANDDLMSATPAASRSE